MLYSLYFLTAFIIIQSYNVFEVSIVAYSCPNNLPGDLRVWNYRHLDSKLGPGTRSSVTEVHQLAFLNLCFLTCKMGILVLKGLLHRWNEIIHVYKIARIQAHSKCAKTRCCHYSFLFSVLIVTGLEL